jgi:hypothetical protein
MMRIIYGGIRIQGFLVGVYADRYPEAVERIGERVRQGLMAHREDLRDDFDRLPETFVGISAATTTARWSPASPTSAASRSNGGLRGSRSACPNCQGGAAHRARTVDDDRRAEKNRALDRLILCAHLSAATVVENDCR